MEVFKHLVVVIGHVKDADVYIARVAKASLSVAGALRSKKRGADSLEGQHLHFMTSKFILPVLLQHFPPIFLGHYYCDFSLHSFFNR